MQRGGFRQNVVQPIGRVMRKLGTAIGVSGLFLLAGCATQSGRFEFGVIGDVPYTAEEEAQLPGVIRAMDNADLAFVTHVGDLQADGRGYRDGLTPCTDQTLANRKAMLQASRHPMIVTPGDNDWTDCHRANPAQDPIARLAAVRESLFPDARTLGQRSFAVTQQSMEPAFSKYRENLRWVYGDIVFITLHTVGSNNNLGRTAEADAEYADRNAANLAWLKQAFDLAKRAHHKALVIITQADPIFEDWSPPFLFTRVLRVAPPATETSGHKQFLAALEAEVAAFERPVLLIHGDTHYFRVDKPLFSSKTKRLIANLTRVETFGSPYVHWVRITVDPSDPGIFLIRPEIVGR